MGILSEQGVHKGFAVKCKQIVHLLAYAYKPHRQLQFMRNGHHNAAFRRAVELGQHNAGHAGRLGEQPRLLQAILPRCCVEHQQNLVRGVPHYTLRGAAHFFELRHQVGFGVEAAGCVHQQQIRPARVRSLERVKQHRGRIAALPGFDHLHA